MALEVKEIIVKVTVDKQPTRGGFDIKTIKTIIHQSKIEILEECKAYIKRMREDKLER